MKVLILNKIYKTKIKIFNEIYKAKIFNEIYKTKM